MQQLIRDERLAGRGCMLQAAGGRLQAVGARLRFARRYIGTMPSLVDTVQLEYI